MVANRHIFQQLPVLAALGRTAAYAAIQKLQGPPERAPALPGPQIVEILPPRPGDLVRDYVRHVGGDAQAYRKTLPPHLFPQWGFALAARTLEGIPYPLLQVVNGGCRIEVNRPLPAGEPLHVSARLESIDDDGRRAVLHQRIVTGTQSAPDAVVAHMYPIVPLGGPKSGAAKGPKKARPLVPTDVREIAYWRISRHAGLDFAKLTGDFNPIHWVPAYARAAGFRGMILHGFSTLARAWEGVRGGVFAGADRIRAMDVKFTAPLGLPARVGLYTDDHRHIWVGDAPGGPAYLVGIYETEDER
jgi:hypothetical protein